MRQRITSSKSDIETDYTNPRFDDYTPKRLSFYRRVCGSMLTVVWIASAALLLLNMIFSMFIMYFAYQTMFSGQSMVNTFFSTPVGRELAARFKAGSLDGLVSQVERLYSVAEPLNDGSGAYIHSYRLDLAMAHEPLDIVRRIARMRVTMPGGEDDDKLPFSKMIVDVGANDCILSSNSRTLVQLGWDAVVVEPLLEELDLCRRHLHRIKADAKLRVVELCELENAMLPNDSEDAVTFYLGGDSVNMEGSVLHDESRGQQQTVTVNGISVASLARRCRVQKSFGVLSVDAEGVGYEIIENFLKAGSSPAYIIHEVIHSDKTPDEVGAQQVRLNIELQPMVIYDAALQRMFERERIPVYLHDYILDCLRTSIKEHVRNLPMWPGDRSVLRSDEAIERVRAWHDELESHSRRKRSENATEQLSAARAGGANPLETKRDADFISAYQSVLRSPQAAEELEQLEHSYSMAIAQLVEQQEVAERLLTERQAASIESTTQRGGALIGEELSRLVSEHVAQQEKLRTKWEEEIAQSKRRQREEYQAFVIDLCEEMERKKRVSEQLVQLEDVSGATSTPIVVDDNGGGASAMSSASAAARKAGTKSKAAGKWLRNKMTKRIDAISTTAVSVGKRVIGDDGAAAPGNTSASTSAAHAGTSKPSNVGGSVTPGSGGSLDRSNRINSSGSVGDGGALNDASGAAGDGDALVEQVEHFRIFLGNQLKTSYNITLVCGDVLDFIQRAPGERAHGGGGGDVGKGKRAMSPYRDTLNAIVLLVDGDAALTTKQHIEFIQMCRVSTDFHFEDIGEQLADVRREIQRTRRLRTGEFFVTKHSNLARAQLAFHFVIDQHDKSLGDAQQLDPKSNMLSGLKNVLALASQYDVHTLTLPVLMLDRGAEAMMSQQDMLKRSQTILFAVKAALQQHCSGEDTLKNIEFVSPTHSEALFKRFRELLS